MNHREVYSTVLLGLALAATTACSDAGEDQAAGDGAEIVGTDQQATTGATPKIDAEFWGELPALPSGVSYTDLGVSSSQIFLARSDRKVEVRTRQFNPPLTNTLIDIGQHIDMVQFGTDWDLVAANDSTQKIYRKSSNVPVIMGSYPAGVTAVQALTANPSAGATSKLKIWIVCGSFPNQVVRWGVHDRNVSPATIVWDGGSVAAGPYSTGLDYAQGEANTYKVFRMVNYTKSYFQWFDVADATLTGNEKTFYQTYTDHAYGHPEGEYDRFAPAGFDQNYADGYFYGIDEFANHSTGRHAWVVARLYRTNIKP